MLLDFGGLCCARLLIVCVLIWCFGLVFIVCFDAIKCCCADCLWVVVGLLITCFALLVYFAFRVCGFGVLLVVYALLAVYLPLSCFTGGVIAWFSFE